MALVKLNNNGVKNATAFGSITGLGNLVFISRSTASSSSSVSITSGINSTYKEYIFVFNNIHPSTASNFTFNLSADSGSNYNVTKTTTNFYAYHNESGSDSGLSYNTTLDLAQGTGYQVLGNVEADNDTSCSGYLHLFEPSSTTFVKHFISRVNVVYPAGTDYTSDYFTAGYGNTTSAIDAVDFKMSSGNIDAGTIQMFGVVK